MCEEVSEHLQDGVHYTLLVKMGTDGQSGRGSFSWKGKKHNDNKRFEAFFLPLVFTKTTGCPKKSLTGHTQTPKIDCILGYQAIFQAKTSF